MGVILTRGHGPLGMFGGRSWESLVRVRREDRWVEVSVWE